MSKTRYLALFLLLSFPNAAFAQLQPFRHFTPNDGLPSWRIYTIVQDRRGFVNVLTEMGIARYDGQKFDVFNVKNGLPFNDIWDACEDLSTGRSWFSTFGPGLWNYDPATDALEKVNCQVPSGKVEEVAADGKGNVYFYSNEFYRVKGDRAEYVCHGLSSPENTSFGTNLVSFKNGFVTSFYNNSVLDIFKDGEKFEFPLLDKVPGRQPKFTIVESRQSAWCYVSDAVYHLDGRQMTKTPAPWLQGFGLRHIQYLKPQGLTLLSGIGFAMLVRGDRLEGTYRVPPGIEITKGCLDSEGNLWLASVNNGVYFFANNSKDALLYEGETHPQIQAVFYDKRRGTTWFADGSGSMFRLEKGQRHSQEVLFPDGSRLDGKIYQIAAWQDYLVIVSQHKGLVFLHIPPGGAGSEIRVELNVTDLRGKVPNRDISTGKKSFALARSVFKQVIPLPNTLLVASSWRLIEMNRLEGGVLNTRQFNEGRSYAIAAETGGSIWSGQPDGLFKLENGIVDSLSELKNRYPELRRNINSLAIDGHQTLWAGHDAGGFALHRGKVYPFSHDFLGASLVRQVVADEHGRVWLATDRGLQCLTITDRDNLQWELAYFNLDDGLASPGINQVFVQGDTVFAATDKGLSMLLFPKKQPDHALPKVTIWQAENRNAGTRFQQDEALKVRDNFVVFHFLATAYRCQGELQFYYCLDVNGTEGEPVPMGNLTNVSLPNLRPGDYVFRIWVKDCNGLESIPAEYPFSIRYPFYLRWWFIAGLALLTAFGLWRWVRTIRLREQEKTATNKKFAEMELQALQSQMNPHFLFNAMQAIQLFIAKNDIYQANLYLANFAKLMRMFLEASKERYIQLKDELEIIRLYVELEKMRFGDKFDYRIVAPEGELAGRMLIPSLLLQPFVENAINHGLRYKQGSGHLLVEVQKPEKHLLSIKIEDDGVGRQKAYELKQQAGAYRSRGMEIITDRLQTLERVDGVSIQIITEDLSDEAGRPAGTRVAILCAIGH